MAPRKHCSPSVPWPQGAATARSRPQSAPHLTVRPGGEEDPPMALSATTPAPPQALNATTMCEALLTTAAEHASRIALRTPDGAVELTYAQLTAQVRATASLLDDLGLRRGDALGIMLVNRPEFHVVDAAAMLLGATPFSLYNSSPAEQLAFVMGDAGNRLIVTEPRFDEVVREA